MTNQSRNLANLIMSRRTIHNFVPDKVRNKTLRPAHSRTRWRGCGMSEWPSTSTSGILISDLQEGRLHPERFVVGHPFNPPYLVPLVEGVGGRHTSPELVDWTVNFYRLHQKHPIKLNKEVPGHLANRLQMALWREAVHAAIEGIASMEDIDAAVTEALGIRWAVVGPHLTVHLAGGPGGIHHQLEHLCYDYNGNSQNSTNYHYISYLVGYGHFLTKRNKFDYLITSRS